MRLVFILAFSVLSFIGKSQSGLRDHQFQVDTPYNALHLMSNDTVTGSPTYKRGDWKRLYEGYGIDINTDSARTITFGVDTTLLVTPYDISTLDPSSLNEAWTIRGDNVDVETITTQTIKFEGDYGIATYYHDDDNILNIEADTSELATQYDLTQITGVQNFFIEGDSICVIDGIDTICFTQDSFYVTDSTLCVISMGDTLCNPINPVPNIPISALFPAVNSNTINNQNFLQNWQWNSLSGSALKLSTTSTAAASNLQRMLDISMSGTNATAGQTTTGIFVSNTHAGTTSINKGLRVEVSGGSSQNRGIEVAATGTASTGIVASGVSIGISASSTTGTGASIFSSSGAGLYTSTLTGLAFEAEANPTSTNTILEVGRLTRGSSGTPANDIGASLNYEIETTADYRVSNQLISKWTDATDATRTSQFIITGVSSATTGDLFTLSGSGALRLNEYGAGTFTGTPTYDLMVDASGNIIETVDDDIDDTNELQTLTIDSSGAASPRTITIGISDGNEVTFLDLSGSGGMDDWLLAASGTGGTEAITDGETVTITGAGINTATRSGANITITGTEVDGSVSNEGVLGVGAGGASSSTLLSTTSGANAVTINVAGILSISESTSANGGSMTITGTEVDGSTTNELNTIEEGNVSVQTGNTTLDFQTLFDVATDGAGEVNISLDLSEATTVTTPEADDWVIMYDVGLSQHQRILWSDLYDLVSGAGDGNGIYDGDGTTPSDTDVSITDNIDFGGGLLFLDDANGEIGIGTVTPDYTLDIEGSTTNIMIYDNNGGSGNQLMLHTNVSATGTGVYGGISFMYTDASASDAWDIEGNRRTNDANHSTFEIRANENSDAQVFIAEKNVSFADNTTESHIAINGGFANTQNYEWTATGAATHLTLDRSYNIVNVSGSGTLADNEVRLPEVNSTSDNWDPSLSSAQVQVGQEYTVSNFRAATNLTVRVFTGDQINNGATTLTIAPGDSYIIKCVRLSGGVGYWKTYD